MPQYNFKSIAPVPTNKQFVDIVLLRTQRKTPTVVHAGYQVRPRLCLARLRQLPQLPACTLPPLPPFSFRQITRIRDFYMRKVKFTQSTFHEKLSAIVDSFPKLDDSASRARRRRRRGRRRGE